MNAVDVSEPAYFKAWMRLLQHENGLNHLEMFYRTLFIVGSLIAFIAIESLWPKNASGPSQDMRFLLASIAFLVGAYHSIRLIFHIIAPIAILRGIPVNEGVERLKVLHEKYHAYDKVPIDGLYDSITIQWNGDRYQRFR